MKAHWHPIEHIELLENGEAFYPRVFEAIACARSEVLIETFILFEDKVGWALHAVLLEAARRGVQVVLTVDGFGSCDLGESYVAPLTAAGVRVQFFDRRPRLLGMRLHAFRRLHRKIVVVDGAQAFIGGINFSADHLGDYGPQAKQDYAVVVQGPLVADIHRFALASAQAPARRRWWRMRPRVDLAQPRPDTRTEAWGAFITRDNEAHPTDIERHYRLAIRMAQRELILAHAYFFPGYRLLRDLRNAARRGVRVRLILQGEPDMPIAGMAARSLYRYLLGAGIEIHEYCERPLHGKVALADDDWATVGSSNLDPWSLSLNLEANVVIWSRAFNQHLRERLEHLMRHHCQAISAEAEGSRRVWRLGSSVLVFHLLRRFPRWLNWLPRRAPRITAATSHPAEPAPHNTEPPHAPTPP
ncbi:cardiolipin synthase ClsB [uncultured Aquabacterium sp.]|uniref:cardiolipin synthase ClsB n=1 Tax=Aquabacterium sp. TaxID=1872578 RepID=UPI0025F3369C|nr:cardiolipin synthase ClsB [uncultured Aquabacterium sp.]